MTKPLTPAAVALNELVQAMQVEADLIEKVRHRDPTDAEDQRLSHLSRRRDALEQQLQRLVAEKLGVDYHVLWHAVTPSGPVPKL